MAKGGITGMRYLFGMAGIMLLLALVAAGLFALALYEGWNYPTLRIALLVFGTYAVIELFTRSGRVPHRVEFNNLKCEYDPGREKYQELTVYCLANSPIAAYEEAKRLYRKSKGVFDFDPDHKIRETLWVTYLLRWASHKTINLRNIA
jgi:hypothetical protein